MEERKDEEEETRRARDEKGLAPEAVREMPGERDDDEVDERAGGYREKDRAALDVEKLGRIAD